jgi:hypothetical protein
MRFIHVDISRSWGVVLFFLIVLSVPAGYLVMRYRQAQVHPMPTSSDQQSNSSTQVTSAQSNDEAREAAIAAAVTYFTLDDRGPVSWGDRMETMVDDPVITKLLEKSLSPVFETASIACVPTASAAWKVVEGTDEVSGNEWQTWRVVLRGTCAWPEPRAAPMGPFAVPWAEDGFTAILVTVFGGADGWRLGLFPVDAIVESQVESSHQRRAD